MTKSPEAFTSERTGNRNGENGRSRRAFGHANLLKISHTGEHTSLFLPDATERGILDNWSRMIC